MHHLIPREKLIPFVIPAYIELHEILEERINSFTRVRLALCTFNSETTRVKNENDRKQRIVERRG